MMKKFYHCGEILCDIAIQCPVTKQSLLLQQIELVMFQRNGKTRLGKLCYSFTVGSVFWVYQFDSMVHQKDLTEGPMS